MGIFSRLFKKQPTEPELDELDVATFIVADMHSHLLPGIDDGAKNIEESIQMIKALQSLGYKQLLCTPHVMHDFYNNSTATIQERLQDLQQSLQRQNNTVKIDAAAEYYFDEELKKRLTSDDIIGFGENGEYLLFEFSYFNEHQGVFDGVTNIIEAGYTPVLAHPERYPYYSEELNKYHELKSLGLHFQINLMSLTGHYGESAKRAAEFLIENNLVEFVGTDIHRIGHIDQIKKVLKNKHLHKLVNSGKLLNHTLV